MSETHFYWIRDKRRGRNRWHRCEEYSLICNAFSLTGIRVKDVEEGGNISSVSLEVGSIPVDAHGVCLNCQRIIEKRERRHER